MSSHSERATSSALNVLRGAKVGSQNSLSDKVEIIQPDQYGDRRSEPRVSCNAHGALLLLSNNEVLNCRILDQSPSGARVAFDSLSHLPAEIWLIDLDTHMARRGSAAWSTPNKMGLKFNFVHTFVSGAPRPAKVPTEVFETYQRLTGDTQAPTDIKGADDNVLYFD